MKLKVNMYKDLLITTKDAEDFHFSFLFIERIDTLRIWKWQLNSFSKKKSNKNEMGGM